MQINEYLVDKVYQQSSVWTHLLYVFILMAVQTFFSFCLLLHFHSCFTQIRLDWPPPPLPKLLIYATAVLLSIITLICLMSLLSLKKLGGPSLAPENSRALICNACSCLVYIPPVSIFFTLPPPQVSKLGSVYIVVSIDTFFKLSVAVIILFWHQGSSFLEKSKTVILAGKTFVLL